MRKFKIPKMPETTSKSIRFPNDVIEEVEAVLVGTDCTFSAFVVEAVRVALENLKEEQEWQIEKHRVKIHAVLVLNIGCYIICPLPIL